MTEEVIPLKKWVIKVIKGAKIVQCPYCGRHEYYPYDECTCGAKVGMPDDSEVVKKEWW